MKILETSTAAPVVNTNPPAVGTGPFSCASRQDGYHADPSSCRVFYRCVGGMAIKFSCTVGTAYNAQLMECDWPSHAHCTSGK